MIDIDHIIGVTYRSCDGYDNTIRVRGMNSKYTQPMDSRTATLVFGDHELEIHLQLDEPELSLIYTYVLINNQQICCLLGKVTAFVYELSMPDLERCIISPPLYRM